MFRFGRPYFLLTAALIGVETFIGFCMHDPVIRPILFRKGRWRPAGIKS